MTSFYTPHKPHRTHFSCSQPLCWLVAGVFWCDAQEHVERRRGRVVKGRCSPSFAAREHQGRPRGHISRRRAPLSPGSSCIRDLAGACYCCCFWTNGDYLRSRPWKVPPVFDARRGPSRAINRARPMVEHRLVRVARTEPVLRPTGAISGDAARRHYRRRYGWPASAHPHAGNPLLFYNAAFTFVKKTREAFVTRCTEGKLGGIRPRSVGEREGFGA